MGAAPDGEAVGQLVGLQAIRRENVHVARPVELGVQAGSGIPVVIAGREQHRAAHRGEDAAKELAGVRANRSCS